MARGNLKLHILMGLPGSGKTTFAAEYQKKNPSVKVWHLDTYGSRTGTKYDVIEAVKKASVGEYWSNEMMLDGLFLTNDEVIKTAKLFIRDGLFFGINLTIHYWIEDRAACLKNDGGRRDVPSTRTIETAVFEAIDDKQLKDEFEGLDISFNVEEHTIQVKPDWYRYFKPHTYVCTDGKLKSMQWCTGGTAGNCYGNVSPLSGEEPLEFVELDELLEKLNPGITFLQYKKIMRECVTTEDSYQNDYYGGITSYMRWVCDLRKLHELLKNM